MKWSRIPGWLAYTRMCVTSAMPLQRCVLHQDGTSRPSAFVCLYVPSLLFVSLPFSIVISFYVTNIFNNYFRDAFLIVVYNNCGTVWHFKLQPLKFNKLCMFTWNNYWWTDRQNRQPVVQLNCVKFVEQPKNFISASIAVTINKVNY